MQVKGELKKKPCQVVKQTLNMNGTYKENLGHRKLI